MECVNIVPREGVDERMYWIVTAHRKNHPFEIVMTENTDRERAEKDALSLFLRWPVKGDVVYHRYPISADEDGPYVVDRVYKDGEHWRIKATPRFSPHYGWINSPMSRFRFALEDGS